MFKVSMIITLCASFLTAVPVWADVNQLPGDTSFEAGPEEWLGGRSIVGANPPFGRYVLELSRSYNHSRIYYGLVKADRSYGLSFSARCPAGPATIKVAAWHVLYGLAALPEQFKLDHTWQRFSLPFQVQKQDRDVYFTVELPAGTTVEIDGLMLAETSDAAYVPSSAPVLSLATTGKPGNIVLIDEPSPVLEVGVAGNAAGASGRLSCRTVDFYGRTRGELVREVNLKPGETLRLNYPALSKNERGYFLVTAELTGADGKVIASTRQPFGVVSRPLELAAEKSFFGLHPDNSRIEMAAIPRIGVKWLRSFNLWSLLEPQAGMVKPFTVRDAEANGLAVMACVKLVENPPAWVPQSGKLLADFNAMSAFLPQLARKSSSAIKVWEIENEPQYIYPSALNMSFSESADYYGKVTDAAGRALKLNDPARKVAALSVSCNSNGNTFLRQAKPLCEKAIDIIALHPYTGMRYIGPNMKTIMPDDYLRKELLLQIKYCAGAQIWAGEVGWAYDTREALDSETIRIFSDYVARTLILLRSIPEVEKVMWFKAQGCYEREYYQYGLWRSEFEPLPAAVFFAGVAERLENARPYRPALESDIRAYTFVSASGHPFAALWKCKGNADRLIVDAVSGRVRLTDLFGQPVKIEVKDGKTVIPLTSTPVWMEVDGLDAEALVKLFSTTNVNVAPLEMNVYFRNDNQVAGMLKNNLPQVKSVTLSAAGAPSQQLELPASGIRSFAYNLPDGVRKYSLKATVAEGETKYDDSGDYLTCVAAKNGWSDLLQGSNAINLKERKYIYPPDPNIGWKSAADFSCRFSSGWDIRYFYFAAEVNDPVHFQPSDSWYAWNGDSVQIAFDTMNDAAEGVLSYNETDVEFIAWLSPQGPRLAKTFSRNDDLGTPVKNGKIEIVRDGTITRYRIAVPWAEMAELNPLSGRIFGMNFIVNQNNGQGRRYWLGLTEGVGEVKYPWLYRRFILAPKDGRK